MIVNAYSIWRQCADTSLPYSVGIHHSVADSESHRHQISAVYKSIGKSEYYK